MITYRRSARALLTDPEGRVLLVRINDTVALDATNPVTDYWITVGGGVEDGESFEAALVREVFEEIGARITDPGPCIWRRRKSLTGADGITRAGDECYYWCRLPTADLDLSNLPDAERAVLREFRWWSLDDPNLACVHIFPEGFLDAARDVLRHGRPDSVRWLSTRE